MCSIQVFEVCVYRWWQTKGPNSLFATSWWWWWELYRRLLLKYYSEKTKNFSLPTNLPLFLVNFCFGLHSYYFLNRKFARASRTSAPQRTGNNLRFSSTSCRWFNSKGDQDRLMMSPHPLFSNQVLDHFPVGVASGTWLANLGFFALTNGDKWFHIEQLITTTSKSLMLFLFCLESWRGELHALFLYRFEI